jgi:hypothetical protein
VTRSRSRKEIYHFGGTGAAIRLCKPDVQYRYFILKKMLIYNRIGASATGAASKILPGAGATTEYYFSVLESSDRAK